MPQSKVLVIGIGNEYRSDDAAGILAARRIEELHPPNVTVIEESGEGARLIEAWKNADTVIIIDAASSGSPSGMIHRLDAARQPIPTKFFHYSTHVFSVAEAIELARTLNQLPPRLIVYGIEGKNFSTGTALSMEVHQAVYKVVELILQEVKQQDFSLHSK
jgi:hydrogenase maturation protease